MRLIPTLLCQPGMRLGKAIFTEKGQVLVGSQYELTRSVIDRLNQMGIQHLCIDEPNTSDIQMVETIREETRVSLHAALLQVIECVSGGTARTGHSIGALCAQPLQLLLNDLKDCPADSVVVMNPAVASSNNWASQWIRNAITCSIYAAQLGRSEGYSADELTALTCGALLHDVGSLKLPSSLLRKQGPLSRDELEIMMAHTTIGYKMLKDQPGVPALAAQCALLHHERMNGSGYPYGTSSRDLHPIVRWVGLIDAYVGMTSPRSYRKALQPHDAMEFLYAGAELLFDLDKVNLFRNRVVTFPPGIGVALHTGETGVVSRVNAHNKQRPVVRVVKNSWGEEIKPFDLDLSVHLSVMIDVIGDDVCARGA